MEASEAWRRAKPDGAGVSRWQASARRRADAQKPGKAAGQARQRRARAERVASAAGPGRRAQAQRPGRCPRYTNINTTIQRVPFAIYPSIVAINALCGPILLILRHKPRNAQGGVAMPAYPAQTLTPNCPNNSRISYQPARHQHPERVRIAQRQHARHAHPPTHPRAMPLQRHIIPPALARSRPARPGR